MPPQDTFVRQDIAIVAHFKLKSYMVETLGESVEEVLKGALLMPLVLSHEHGVITFIWFQRQLFARAE